MVNRLKGVWEELCLRDEIVLHMNDLAYFEYAAILYNERYLIEVNTRNPFCGNLHGQWEIEEIAKECLALAVGGGYGEGKGFEPNPISEINAQVLKKVQQILRRPDSVVFLVE